MQKHTKTYMRAFRYDISDCILSEISNNPANATHHIDARGAGGSKDPNKERVENYMAVTWDEHLEYGDKTKYMKALYEMHRDVMIEKGVKFDQGYMQSLIDKHEETPEGIELKRKYKILVGT